MRVLLLFTALMILPGLAVADGTIPPPQKPAPAAAAPAQELDRLFAALAKAQSEDEANPIEDRIQQLFRQSGSPTIDLLMTRGEAALVSGDAETALQLFASVTGLAPDFAEGWHHRAQIELLAGDDEAAMIALQKTITLNPRHFVAMARLAGLLEDYGDKKGALALYRKVLALDPADGDVVRAVRALSRAVEGQGI
jgi:predicted TPR repeat methyltransferase